MDWVKGFQRSLDYIEAHLTDEPSIEDIAAQLNISAFYYQKIFGILCGYSPVEYIRSRRLSLAGEELTAGDTKVIDAALKYGYDTPEGFSRAFAKFHGVTPAEAKKGAPVRSFARLSVEIAMKGGNSMNYKIEKKQAFKMLARQQRFEKITDIVNRKDIPEFWDKCSSDGTLKYLEEQVKKDGILRGSIAGMCMEDSTVKKDFPYLIGTEYSGSDVPEGFKLIEIPAAEWAVFDAGKDIPLSVQHTFHSIFAEFFPSSNYKPTGNFDLEVYLPDNSGAEIWIAVEKK